MWKTCYALQSLCLLNCACSNSAAVLVSWRIGIYYTSENSVVSEALQLNFYSNFCLGPTYNRAPGARQVRMELHSCDKKSLRNVGIGTSKAGEERHVASCEFHLQKIRKRIFCDRQNLQTEAKMCKGPEDILALCTTESVPGE